MDPAKTYLTKEQIKPIVLRLANGEEEAIAILYRQYFNRLKHYGLQIVGSSHENLVINVIQNFYIWLVQNHQKMKEIDDFEIYLFSSVRSNIISQLKKQRQKKDAAHRYLEKINFFQFYIENSPEEAFIAEELAALNKQMLTEELDKLPSYQREVLYLRYFKNYSYKEIGQILSVSEQISRNYSFRAIKRLKEQMQQLRKVFKDRSS